MRTFVRSIFGLRFQTLNVAIFFLPKNPKPVSQPTYFRFLSPLGKSLLSINSIASFSIPVSHHHHHPHEHETHPWLMIDSITDAVLSHPGVSFIQFSPLFPVPILSLPSIRIICTLQESNVTPLHRRSTRIGSDFLLPILNESLPISPTPPVPRPLQLSKAQCDVFHFAPGCFAPPGPGSVFMYQKWVLLFVGPGKGKGVRPVVRQKWTNKTIKSFHLKLCNIRTIWHGR